MKPQMQYAKHMLFGLFERFDKINESLPFSCKMPVFRFLIHNPSRNELRLATSRDDLDEGVFVAFVLDEL